MVLLIKTALLFAFFGGIWLAFIGQIGGHRTNLIKRMSIILLAGGIVPLLILGTMKGTDVNRLIAPYVVGSNGGIYGLTMAENKKLDAAMSGIFAVFSLLVAFGGYLTIRRIDASFGTEANNAGEERSIFDSKSVYGAATYILIGRLLQAVLGLITAVGFLFGAYGGLLSFFDL